MHTSVDIIWTMAWHSCNKCLQSHYIFNNLHHFSQCIKLSTTQLKLIYNWTKDCLPVPLSTLKKQTHLSLFSWLQSYQLISCTWHTWCQYHLHLLSRFLWLHLLFVDLHHMFHIIQIVTYVEVTIENYFPEVGNISRGRRTMGIFPLRENNFQ